MKKEDNQAKLALTNWLGTTPTEKKKEKESSVKELVKKIEKDDIRKKVEDPAKNSKVKKLLEFFQPVKEQEENKEGGDKKRTKKMLEEK